MENISPAPSNLSWKRNILTFLILALVGTVSVRAGAAFLTSSPAALFPSNGAYLGAFVGSRSGESHSDALVRVESQIGRKFAIDHYYYQWTDSFPNAAQA